MLLTAEARTDGRSVQPAKLSDFSLLVPCSTCGAVELANCQENGKYVAPHTERQRIAYGQGFL